MNKYKGHFKTVVKHKLYVLNAARQSGILWRGITHDLSKFSFKEFVPSAKYFNGIKSPIAVEKETTGYSKAWANHKGKNTHHWEHWTDFNKGELFCLKMPIKDVKELLCDWVGAGKAYNKNKWTPDEAMTFYMRKKDQMFFHDETRVLIEKALNILIIAGEKPFYTYIKKEMKYE